MQVSLESAEYLKVISLCVAHILSSLSPKALSPLTEFLKAGIVWLSSLVFKVNYVPQLLRDDC